MEKSLLIKKLMGLLNEVKKFNETHKDIGDEGELIAYITEYLKSNDEIDVLLQLFQKLEYRRKFVSMEREQENPSANKPTFLKIKSKNE